MQKNLTIILFIFSLILTWSLVGFSSSLLSIVFDDFNDNLTDPTKWLTSVVGDGPIISEEQGRLAITLPANSEDAPAQSFFGAGYLSICLLRGDFDLQVDYSLIDWPASNGVRVGLSLDSNSEPPRDYNVSRVSFGNMDFLGEPREVYFYGDGITETQQLSGNLRIKRAGTLLTGYYMDGANWISLDAIQVTPADLHFGVSAWSHNYAFANQNVKMAFDNLTILDGEIVCPDGSTPTAIPATTPTFVPTALPTDAPTNTPQTSFVYLALVSKQPTATPTATSTNTPTKTPRPTETPTPIPTPEPSRPTLEDGDYQATISGDTNGWIHFRVTEHGTRASLAYFSFKVGNPFCHDFGYTFYDPETIDNGKFHFFADAASLNPNADMTCSSTSSTRASCIVRDLHGAAGDYPFCSVASGIAHHR